MQKLARLGLLAALIAAWQLASIGGLPDYLLSPAQIAREFFAALGSQELYVHAGASLMRALPGFVIGSALGIAFVLYARTR